MIMRFLHTADLHIGKTVHEFSMMEEQRHILNRIVEIAREEQVEAILLAGDIYDRSVPQAEAVELLDAFLTALVQEQIKVFLISGNHDSPERLSFAEQILEAQGVYLAGNYKEELRQIRLQDEYGDIVFVMMPFVKPSRVGKEIRTSQQAVDAMLAQAAIPEDGSTRYVLLTHYFVTNSGRAPELSDSETSVNVGGLDHVEADSFKGFDYVALGHIHKRQQIGKLPVYYAGTPLKYSFSEVSQRKTVQIVELKRKGQTEITVRELIPLHDMRSIKGRLEELIREDVADLADRNDYIQAILTNQEELIDPIGTLRSVYPNTMQVLQERESSQQSRNIPLLQRQKSKTIAEWFEEFYEYVREESLDEGKQTIIQEVIHEVEL